MQKNILSEYQDTKKEIADIKVRIDKAREKLRKIDLNQTVKDTVSGGMGGIQHFVIEGVPVAEYTRQKTLLQRRILQLEKLQEKLEEMTADVEEYINSIESSRMRQIMRYRYIDSLSWRSVAKRLGPGNMEDSVRIEHDRFMKKQSQR